MPRKDDEYKPRTQESTPDDSLSEHSDSDEPLTSFEDDGDAEKDSQRERDEDACFSILHLAYVDCFAAIKRSCDQDELEDLAWAAAGELFETLDERDAAVEIIDLTHSD